MSLPKQLTIKESLGELKQMLKKGTPLIAPRIRVLIEMKKAEETGISKRDLASAVGVNHNSVQTWRALYQSGGIKALCSHNRKGFKPSVFTKEEHAAIAGRQRLMLLLLIQKVIILCFRVIISLKKEIK